MRFCQKLNCDIPAISRGKYCEKHKTNKVKKEEPQFVLPKTEVDAEHKLKIEEDRLIREEQDLQFRETESKDRERLEQIEFEKVLEMSRQNYFEELKNELNSEIDIDINNCFNIKFQFPNGLKIVKKFRHDVKVKTIKNYVDVHIHENNLGIKNYNLVLNFPKIELDDGFYSYEIKELTSSSNFVIHIRDIDA